MSDTAKRLEVEFSTSTKLCAWKCDGCEPPGEFVILTVSRGDGEDGPYSQVWNWGNWERPPFCPHCGSKEKVSR